MVLLAVVSVVTLGATPLLFSAATWAATTALIIGTTYVPDPTKPVYWHGATEYYVNSTTGCGVQICTYRPVYTPEQAWPFTGWNDLTIDASIAQGTAIVDDLLRDELATGSDPIVVLGESQSSSILTLEKREFAGLSPAEKSRLTFVLVANPNRPNGGLLERIAAFNPSIIELPAIGATPTDTGIRTIDIAFQYDGIADFPRYPLNLLADLNTLIGAYIHGSYMVGLNGYTEDELLEAINDPNNRQTYGDTTYVTIPAKHLPLLLPLRQFGEITGSSGLTTPLADLIEPTLTVLVELGYDRDTSYGEPTTFGLFPKTDPSKLASDLAAAREAGIDAALADLGLPARSPAAAATVAAHDNPIELSTATARLSAREVPHRADSAAAGSARRAIPRAPDLGVSSEKNPTAVRAGMKRTGTLARYAGQRPAHRRY
jgi:PE-PPE domain